MGSQFELHPIIGDFPSGFTHGEMFGTLFVQHRVCIVDVDENALGLTETKRPLQHAAFAPKRKMTHVASRSSAARRGNEVVGLPEGAVERGYIACVSGA